MLKFEKVTYEQFRDSIKDIVESDPIIDKDDIRNIYDNIKLPKRATAGSAGYDFFIPFGIMIEPGETIKVPTGIRALMPKDTVLMIYPRSGLGFKYRLQLDNTVGIIDSDYADSDNEGHIFIKVTNDTKEAKLISLSAGNGFAQGIFVNYLTTDDDDSTDIRNGGFGSTT